MRADDNDADENDNDDDDVDDDQDDGDWMLCHAMLWQDAMLGWAGCYVYGGWLLCHALMRYYAKLCCAVLGWLEAMLCYAMVAGG
eukprot:7469791-Karenia_brevis.AAC.1